MKTLLLNDTSWYHSGCKEVIQVLSNYYDPTMMCDNRNEIDLSIIQEFDRVILNGEGTLHHNAPWAKKFLGYLREAQRLGKETHIVNTVWQEMGNDWDDVLQNASLIEVRDVLSKNEMQTKNNKTASIVLDASIHSDVEYKECEFTEVSVGGSFYGKLNLDWDTYNSIDIFKDSWFTLVNKLRHSRLLITGRHHEMYAALKARTPVITVPGNTWKNEAFFYTMNQFGLVMEPTRENIFDTLNGKYDNLWKEVWDTLDNMKLKYA
jgi:polysaccharide pyruvyl transferase WcaK-like protein